MMRKLLLAACGSAVIVAGAQAQVTNLWNDPAPSGGTMNLTSSDVGGAHGDVGVFTSSTQTSTNHLSRYSSAGQDWSAFAGLDWAMTADIYITSAQLADAAISGDEISFEVGGIAGGNLLLSDAAWWTPDAWNTVHFNGTFDVNANNLTNATAAFVNNDQTNHPAGDNYLIDNLNLDVELRDTKWVDQAPAGGDMGLNSIPDPFGTGHGNIGEYTSGVQWQNYASTTMNLSANAGRKWRLSFEVYITSAQLADTNIVDDLLYCDVAGSLTGWLTISSGNWTADAWNKVVWTGTLPPDPAAVASVTAYVLVNNKLTNPTLGGPCYYFDNFELDVQSAAALPSDVLWTDNAPAGGGMGLTLVTNAYGTGIGEYVSSNDPDQYSDYGTTNNVWSNYAGKAWSMTCDIYVPAAQAADTNVTDDAIYYQVAGDIGGWIDVETVPADEWTTLTWNGAFTNAPDALTDVSALIVNNNELTHPLGVNYYIDNFTFQADTPIVEDENDDLWKEQAPEGGDMALVKIPDPYGTFQGDIGMFDSNTASGQQSGYGLAGVDWGAYAGSEWSLSFDVYITAAQLADAAVSDDTIYVEVGGAVGGHTSVSSLIADEWNTVKLTGTFTNEALALANASCLLMNDDMGTQPSAGVNYCVDNFLLQSVQSYISPPPVYEDFTEIIEFVVAEEYSNGDISGQKGWTNQASVNGNWVVDTSGEGSVTTTNREGCNMTWLQSMPLIAGQTIDYTFYVTYLGVHDYDSWTYPGRLGFTTSSAGVNVGYDSDGDSKTQATYTFQASGLADGQFRLFGDGWGGPSTQFISANTNDLWAIRFWLTMGDSPATTRFGTTLTNVTSGTFADGGIETDGVGEELYAALKDGTAYPYFESAHEAAAAPDYDGNTGLTISKLMITYPVPLSDSYTIWAAQKGLSGENSETGSDPDQDGLINLGEYAFKGDPHGATGSDDQGTQPVLDGFTYKYSVIGDPTLTAEVLTTDDLRVGWNVSDTVIISEDDGQLSEYTYDTSGNETLFIRVEVSRQE